MKPLSELRAQPPIATASTAPPLNVVIAPPWAPAGSGAEQVFGFVVERLRLVDQPDVAAAVSAQVSLLVALGAHRGVRFVLQHRLVPTSPSADASIVIEVLVVVGGVDGAGEYDVRAEVLAREVADALGGLDRWFEIRPIVEAERLLEAVVPFAPSSSAEIVRREDKVGAGSWRRGLGFAADLETAVNDDLLAWSMLSSAGSTPTPFYELLLRQRDPVVARVVIEPTEVTAEERGGVADLCAKWSAAPAGDSLGVAAQRALRAVVFGDPAFEVQISLASTAPLSRTLVSMFGAVISPPDHDPTRDAALSGGFDVFGPFDEAAPLTACVSELRAGGPTASSTFPGDLPRLRRVMGPHELSAAFRLPLFEGRPVPGLRSSRTPSMGAPDTSLPESGLVIGDVHGRSLSSVVRVGGLDRHRHTYVLGQTGTGKSTLLLNLIVQDIEAGDGVAVIDPHGDLVEAVLERIPDGREADVVLVDPADPVAVVGVNLLEAETPLQAEYLVSDLCDFFQQLYDPTHSGIVGPRFQAWLRYAAQTVLPVPSQGTLCDLPRLFTDDEYLKFCFRHVHDPLTQDFWTGEMAQTNQHSKSEMLGWFNSKFEAFRTNRLMRGVLGQPQSTFSFTDVMDSRRILLVKLSKGLMGTYNANLMGYVMFVKIWAAALSRAAMPSAERVPFHVYADEFQTMTSPALPDILSEARKFGLSLTLVNQFFGQLKEPVREAVLGNVGTKVAFRMGALDATLFGDMHGGREISAEHLRWLPNFVAMANLLTDGEPIAPILVDTRPPVPAPDGAARAAYVRDCSRRQWGVPRDSLDFLLDDLYVNYRNFDSDLWDIRYRPPRDPEVPANSASSVTRPPLILGPDKALSA